MILSLTSVIYFLSLQRRGGSSIFTLSILVFDIAGHFFISVLSALRCMIEKINMCYKITLAVCITKDKGFTRNGEKSDGKHLSKTMKQVSYGTLSPFFTKVMPEILQLCRVLPTTPGNVVVALFTMTKLSVHSIFPSFLHKDIHRAMKLFGL